MDGFYNKKNRENLVCGILFACIPFNCKGFFLGLGTRLFVKVLRPGDSEGTFSVFESSSRLLLPVLTIQR